MKKNSQNRKALLNRMTAIVTLAMAVMFGFTLIGSHFTAIAEGTGIAETLSGNSWDISSLYKDKDVDSTWNENKVTVVELSEKGTDFDSDAVSLSGSTLTISKKGDYLLSGTWTGQIVVDEPEDGRVRLILNGVTLISEEGPAIYSMSDGKLVLTLADGTVNTVSDKKESTVIDEEGKEDTLAAVIWAENDITINGSGSLIVNANAKHGIQCKSDLIIAGGSVTITSAGDGIRGRNSVLILDGDITVNAQGDGISSTRSNKEDKGYVIIAGGTVTVTTADGAGESQSEAGVNRFGTGHNGWGDWGTAQADGTVSTKGIKAVTDLVILGGTLNLDCADDGLHANNVTVNGGNLTIASGDDGIHADDTLTIAGGTVNITQSYEGLEACWILITGGDTDVMASDDGLNATEGKTTGNNFNEFAEQNAGVTVSGGTLNVNSGGDGLDSNGAILIAGGVVTVSGPTSNYDAAVDFNGTCRVTGGTLVAVGSSGMLENLNSVANQAALVMKVGSFSAGSVVELYDSEDNLLLSFKPAKTYSSIIITTPDMQVDKAYTVKAGGSTAFSGTLSSPITTSGNVTNFNNPSGGSGGGPGGR